LIAVSRFLPDALSKLSLARDKNYLETRFTLTKSIAFAFSCIFLLGVFASYFTRLILGDEWVLPLLTLFGIALVELLRGFHALITVNVVRAFAYSRLKKVSVIQISVGVLFQPLLIHFFGIVGSIISSAFIFIFGIIYLKDYINA
jgi:O-antigen/teichoic acid export membrane protein